MIKREKIQKLFGEVVRKERNLHKITQSELAERSNLDNTYISQIERGLANPSIYTLYKIADSLKLSEKEIFQKMTEGLSIESNASVSPEEELEIIYDAVVKLDASLLLTTTHDDDFRVIFCNEAFLNFTGLKRKSIIGKKLVDILADENNNKKLLQFLEKLKVGSTDIDYITGKANNGEFLHLEINASPVIGNRKQIEKHLFILRQKFFKIKPDPEIPETVDKYKALVNESNHRIKNNLSMITGVIDIHIMDVEDEKAKSILRDTQLRISSIAHIHELLTTSDDHSKLGIRDYLEKLTSVIRNTYECKKGVKLETAVGVDDLGINQIIALGLLSNELITNSYKHAFENHSNGKIKLNLNPGKNGELRFAYEDNGSGFDKTIFEEGDTLGINLIHTFMKQLEAKDIIVDSNGGFKLEFIFDE